MTSLPALPTLTAAGGSGVLATAYQGVNYLKQGSAALTTVKTIASKAGLLSKPKPASINEQNVPQQQPESNPVVPLVVIGILAKLLLF
jgi:hypothetical protein